jgi:hypothetical protein
MSFERTWKMAIDIRWTIVLLSLVLMACSSGDGVTQPDPTASGSITGRVFHQRSNQPVAGVRLFTAPSSTSSTTDDRGAYQIDSMAPGPYSIHALYSNGDTIARSSISVAVLPTHTTTADIILAPYTADRRFIQGSVVDEHQRPVSDAAITTQPTTNDVRTGADGTFLISDVPPTMYTITAKKGQMVGVIQLDASTRRVSDTVIVVSILDTSAGVINGMVLEGDRALPGVVVEVWPSNKRDTTDEQGWYAIRDIAPGTYDVSYYKPGYVTRIYKFTAQKGKEHRRDVQFRQGSDIPQENLVLYTTLNGESSDHSPFARPTKLRGGSFTEDRFKNPQSALECNGDDGVDVEESDVFNGLPLTIGAWVYIPRGQPKDQFILGKSDAPWGSTYFLHMAKDQLCFTYQSNLRYWAIHTSIALLCPRIHFASVV